MADMEHFILKPTLNAMNDILQMNNCELQGVEGVPVENGLSVNPGHFDLEFDATYQAVHPAMLIDNLPELTVVTGNTNYTIPRYNAHFEGTIMMGGEELQHFDLRFSKLTQKSIDHTKPYFWRFVYPISSNEWFLKVRGLGYKDDFGITHAFNLITTELGGQAMKMFSTSYDNRHWMVIDSTEPVPYEEMDRRVMSLTVSLGFVLGKRYGDYCFHLASNEPTFSQIVGIEALSLQKTKYCPFKILHTDNNIVEGWLGQYAHQQYALEELKSQQEGDVRWYYNDDASVTMDAFGKLSQLCYKTNDMLLATSMLIDGSLMTIEYQKPFFHVTLETITTALMKGEDMTLPPVMPQEQYQAEVVPVLKAALVTISILSKEALKVFNLRIDHNLNAAPNANKLEACFPKYGYELTVADKEAIKKRNSTFHGHLTSEKKPLREQQDDFLSMSLRLHKLCSILLLKAAGFEGKVINNEVLFGLKEACERKEPIYIGI